MHPPETQLPAIAQALGRLRQPRPWPYAPRPAAPKPADPEHDFLRVLPEPALTGDLPAAPRPARDTLTAVEAIALAPMNRTFWFDL